MSRHEYIYLFGGRLFIFFFLYFSGKGDENIPFMHLTGALTAQRIGRASVGW